MSEPIRLTREKLYELVWSEPGTKIGEKFDVSDVAIAKICRKMDIPRPPRGYWARKQHGYPTERVSLPEPAEDTLLEYWLHPTDRPTVTMTDVEPPEVEVSERLSRPNKTLKEIRTELKGCRPDDFGRIGRSEGAIHVSKATYSRACRILDALFKELIARGHAVEYRDGKARVLVGNEKVYLAISEPSRRIELDRGRWGYRRWEFRSTGKLVLSLSGRRLQSIRRQWSDGIVQRLEDLLGRLVVAIEQAPSIIKAKRAEEERREQKWRRRQTVRERERSVLELSKIRASSLDMLVADMRKAEEVRQFVASVESCESVSASLARQARWAKIYADHLDPLVDYRIDKLDCESVSYEPERTWHG